MLAKTHLTIGILCGAILIKFVKINDIIEFFIYFGLIMLGSLLPDIDHKNSKINNKIKISKLLTFIIKHRGVTHSILALILLSVLLWRFAGELYAISLFIGYSSHLLIDAITKEGVCLFSPLSKFRIRGIIRTGKIIEKAIFWLALGVLLIVLYYALNI